MLQRRSQKAEFLRYNLADHKIPSQRRQCVPLQLSKNEREVNIDVQKKESAATI